ncbi:MAG: LysR family transcriptional regulator [Rickettsiales bacterium]|nr:LysR family transcriptional regulator [Rickettsiales bacterium]
MKFDLKSIETFVYVAQLKSFIRTAEALKVAKSHITTRINNLEKIAGATLLARTTREVNLTSEGEEFLHYCKAIMEQVEQLEDFLNAKKDIDGVLKIALPPYFSRYHIVPYLKEFLELHPHLKLDIFLTENPMNIIEEGYDLQVRMQISDEENLKIEKLMTNRKVICASQQYIKKHGAPKTPEDLLKHDCIVFGENKIWEFRCLKTKKITQLRKMTSNIKCNNGEIIKELLLAGGGITIKSARDIENEIKDGKIVLLLQDYEVINKTSFYVVYPSKKYKSPKIKAFIEFFQGKLGG